MKVGNLIVDIGANVARLQQDMAQAKGIVAGAVRDIERFASTAKTALAGIGVGLGVGAIAAMAREINRATAALDDMAEVTGTTVENMSRLQVVAKIGGHEMSLVEDSLVKLTKGLKGADEETKNAGAALKFLGISAKDASGNLRDPGEIVKEVAAKLVGFKDDAGKTALALDLFGKSGAKLLPFLKDLAQEGEVAARVTAEQAAQAEELEKNLNRLKVAGEDAKREFMIGLTPALLEFTEQLVAAQRATGGLLSGLREVALLRLGPGTPREQLESIDAEIARRREANLTMGRMPGYQAAIMANTGEIMGLERRRAVIGRILGLNMRGLAEDAAGNITAEPARARGATGYRGAPVAAAAGGGKERTLQDALNDLYGVNKSFLEDWNLLQRAYMGGKLSAEHYAEAIQKLVERQGFAKDAARASAEALKDEIAQLEANYAASQALGQGKAELVRAFAEEAQALELESDLVNASAAEREKAVAFRKIEQAAQRATIGQTAEEIAKIYELAEAQKRQVGALIDTRVAREEMKAAVEQAQRETQEAFQRRSDNLTRVISDGLMRGFEKGSRSGAQVLIDTIRNALKTAVFEPVIHAIISPVSRAVTGSLMGLGATSAFAGGGGGGGGIGNLLSFGSTAYNAATGQGLFGLIGGGGYGVATGGLTASALASEAAALGIGSAYGGAGLVGAALPWVGGALAIGGALGLFGGGGGPKDSEAVLGFDYRARNFGLGDNNAPGAAGPFAALAAELSDATKYDVDALAAAIGPETARKSFMAGPGDIGSLMNQVRAFAEPYRINGQARLQARSALQAAQDPTRYWQAQVSAIAGDLGTSARSLEEWRTAFLSAMDAPLSEASFQKWQALGAAIEQAGAAAGRAGAEISTSSFRTLVDYRRAVRLAGGVPRFASGGYHAGGLALVGEAGPELVSLPPGRIYNNGETRRMLEGDGVELRLERLERVMTAVALYTSRTARRLERWDGEGAPVRGVDPAAPLEVAIAP